MNKDELKKKVCEAIDEYAGEIHNFTDDIYNNAELGYK